MDKRDRKKLREQYAARRGAGGVYAIKNTDSGKRLLMVTEDLPGSANRFAFAVQTGGCVHPKLTGEWGKSGFEFEVIEELHRKDAQTDKAFAQELQALYELACEKYAPEKLY